MQDQETRYGPKEGAYYVATGRVQEWSVAEVMVLLGSCCGRSSGAVREALAGLTPVAHMMSVFDTCRRSGIALIHKILELYTIFCLYASSLSYQIPTDRQHRSELFWITLSTGV